MDRVKRNLHFLQFLCKANPKFCRCILKAANNDLIRCLCECIINVLKGNLKLTDKQKQKLKIHKKCLRQLGDKKLSLQRKKKILNQKGGTILPLILPAALSLIGSILKK